MKFEGKAVAVGRFMSTDIIFPSEAILTMDEIDVGQEVWNPHPSSLAVRGLEPVRVDNTLRKYSKHTVYWA